ncbi:phosphate-starvation-inducible PsiE family protein [Pelagibacterales bacterium SAG-MED28]|nr:phosphate-starvation-inducible PsiE family protein [Pelagibacterales bacterium SAG-MED28]
MNQTIRNIQLTAVLIVLISTVVAFFLEMRDMYFNRDITLADLLLMFIYIEVIGLVRSYWETRAVRITYPLVIAITALARFIILQDKESDPSNLIYISVAILIVAIATVIIRFRNSKYLKIDKSKSGEL